MAEPKIPILKSYREYDEILKMLDAISKMNDEEKNNISQTIAKEPKKFKYQKGVSVAALQKIETNLKFVGGDNIPTLEQIKASRDAFVKENDRKKNSLKKLLEEGYATESQAENARLKGVVRGGRLKKFFTGFFRALMTAGLVVGSVLFGALLGGPVGIGLSIGFGVAAALHHGISAIPFWRAIKKWNAQIREAKNILKADNRTLGSDKSAAKEFENVTILQRELGEILSDEKSEARTRVDARLGTTVEGKEGPKENTFTDEEINEYVASGKELYPLPFVEERLNVVSKESWIKRIESGKAPIVNISGGRNEKGETLIRTIGISEDILKEIPIETWIKYTQNGGDDKFVPETIKADATYIEATKEEEPVVENTLSVDEKDPVKINDYVTAGGDLSKLSEEQLKLVSEENWKTYVATVDDPAKLPENVQNCEGFKNVYAEAHPEIKEEPGVEDNHVVEEQPEEEEKVKYGESQFDKIQNVINEIFRILNDDNMSSEEKEVKLKAEFDKVNNMIIDDVGTFTIDSGFKQIFDKTTTRRGNSITRANKLIEALFDMDLCDRDENGRVVLKEGVADSTRPVITSVENEEEVKKFKEEQERIKLEEEERKRQRKVAENGDESLEDENEDEDEAELTKK